MGATPASGSTHPDHSEGHQDACVAYRNKGTGKVTWLTLGRYPDVPLARARELANDARKTAALDGTPLTPKVQRARSGKKTKTYVRRALCPLRSVASLASK